MEAHCPEAWLLNYTNPLTKLCEAQSRLSSIRVVGLCHGVFDGMRQMAHLLDLPVGPARRPCERSEPLLLVRVRPRPGNGRRPLPATQAPRARGPLAARLGRDRPEPRPLPGVRSLPEPGREPHRRVPGMGAGVPGQQPAPVLLRPRGGCALGDREDADLALQPVGPPHGRARVPRRTARPPARQRAEPTRTSPTRTRISLPPTSWGSPSWKGCCAASTPPSRRSTCRTRATCPACPRAPSSRSPPAPTRAACTPPLWPRSRRASSGC